MYVVEYTKNLDDVLVGIITDKAVISRIYPVWEKDAFESDYCNLIVDPCMAYYETYKDAPGSQAVRMIREYCKDKGCSDFTLNSITGFLEHLSSIQDRQEEVNVDFIVDKVIKEFNTAKARRLVDALQLALDTRKLDRFDSLLSEHKRIEVGDRSGIDFFLNKDEIRSIFSRKRDVLVQYPEGLGHFFGDCMSRDNFVAFLAPQGTGKSWWLLDLAFRATEARKKVAYFQVGDMTRQQVEMRLLTRLTEIPYKSWTNEWPLEVKIPNYLRAVKGSDPELDFDVKIHEGPLDKKTALTKCREFTQRDEGASYFRLFCCENYGITVPGISSIISQWSDTGFIPDVVVIDYADNIKSSSIRREQQSWDSLGEIWSELRGLSMKQHCLLVTATQANASSYSKRTMDRGSVSGSNIKKNHVTAMAAINQTDKEQKRGLYRLNWIKLREGEHSRKKTVLVASCLAIGNPCVMSTFS